MSLIFKNTMLLTVIQLCSYIVPLIELPFLARVLSVSVLGQIIFAQVIALTLSFFVEYGFNLTASRSLANILHKNNQTFKAELIGIVLQAKIILLTIVSIICFFIYSSVDIIFEKIPQNYLFWMYLSIVGFGFSSFWYFQAYERLAIATTIEFFSRIIYLILILMLVEGDVDAIKVLQIQSLCTLIGAFGQFLLLYNQEKIVFLAWSRAWHEITNGWHTFIYKSSSSISALMSVWVLGFLVSPQAVSYYAGAEKIIKAIVGLTQPLILASYPKFSRLSNKDQLFNQSLIKKYCYISLLLLAPVVFMMIFLSPQIIRFFLGDSFYPAINVFYILVLLIPLRMLTSIIGHLGLLAAQKDKLVSHISLISSILCLLIGIAFSAVYSEIGMAITVVIIEFLVLLLYAKVFWIKRVM